MKYGAALASKKEDTETKNHHSNTKATAREMTVVFSQDLQKIITIIKITTTRTLYARRITVVYQARQRKYCQDNK